MTQMHDFSQKWWERARLWFETHDWRAKEEGWLLTNNAEGQYCIAKVDDPAAWEPPKGKQPLQYSVSQFDSDEEVFRHVLVGCFLRNESWYWVPTMLHMMRLPIPHYTSMDQAVRKVLDPIADWYDVDGTEGEPPQLHEILSDIVHDLMLDRRAALEYSRLAQQLEVAHDSGDTDEVRAIIQDLKAVRLLKSDDDATA